ncbi:MAG: 50S ribosomal protein L9 [bacterium]|nr:50S ribosomal protein L9 [bacterium]
MKVLFTQNVKNVALVGDVKDVKPGYARNFLFPKNLAKPATEGALKEVELLKKKRLEQEAATKKQAEEMVGLFDGVVLDITEEASESGNLYAAINEERIVKELADKKLNIKPEQVNIAEPIKKVGEHEVEVELHSEVKTKIKINVSRPEPTELTK